MESHLQVQGGAIQVALDAVHDAMSLQCTSSTCQNPTGDECPVEGDREPLVPNAEELVDGVLCAGDAAVHELQVLEGDYRYSIHMSSDVDWSRLVAAADPDDLSPVPDTCDGVQCTDVTGENALDMMRQLELFTPEHNAAVAVVAPDDSYLHYWLWVEATAVDEVDDDGDGWASGDGDCDDGDPTIHPDAEDMGADRATSCRLRERMNHGKRSG